MRRGDHFPALDGLRALAFLMVFGHHYLSIWWGWVGVDLFFVLSGFLITGILYDTQEDPHRYRNFYIRRALRIFPLYYGIILLCLPMIVASLPWSWIVWPAYLGNFAQFGAHVPYEIQAFAPSFPLGGERACLYLGHFWSLCVEEQFYLIWPAVVFTVRDRQKLLRICAFSVPICLTLRALCAWLAPYWLVHDRELLYRATPLRIDALLMGGLLALLIRGPERETALRVMRRSGPFALAAALLWLTMKHSSSMVWLATFVDTLSLVLIGVAIQPGFVSRILQWRPLRWLGGIIYGLYVYHDIPYRQYGWMARHLSPNHSRALGAVIALLTTVLVSWLSYHLYESRFLRLKDRWTTGRV